jgi:hypothetical protein
VSEHEIECCSFDDLRILLKTRDECTNNKGVTIGVIILFSITVDSFLNDFDAGCCDEWNLIELDGIIRLKALGSGEYFGAHEIGFF